MLIQDVKYFVLSAIAPALLYLLHPCKSSATAPALLSHKSCRVPIAYRLKQEPIPKGTPRVPYSTLRLGNSVPKAPVLGAANGAQSVPLQVPTAQPIGLLILNNRELLQPHSFAHKSSSL